MWLLPPKPHINNRVSVAVTSRSCCLLALASDVLVTSASIASMVDAQLATLGEHGCCPAHATKSEHGYCPGRATSYNFSLLRPFPGTLGYPSSR